ncbi:hypothetical protein BMW22_08670 [Rhizobium leguminosarum]|uniref:Uncharacterized protein n=1 Tax=Rhizobium leguminosarum TaxID=384 RepID=A0A1L3Z7S2_RHILE|nr:hypothetical protein BMW22_08670 [Rhizobium leguminosarum]
MSAVRRQFGISSAPSAGIVKAQNVSKYGLGDAAKCTKIWKRAAERAVHLFSFHDANAASSSRMPWSHLDRRSYR